MGGSVKKLLPLVALAAVGFATGPAGMGLWGTAAPVAGAGVAAGGVTAAQAGLFAGANATVMGSALAPAVAAIPAAAPSFFSTLATDFTSMSTLEKVGLGLKGVSALGGLGGSMINAQGQEAALAFQEAERRRLQAADEMDITQAELDSQKRLRRTLAALGNFYGATGINASEGSAARLSDAAFGDAGGEMDLLKTRRDLSRAGAVNVGGSFALQRRRQAIRGAGGAVGSLLDFGADALDTVERRRRV